MLIILNVLSLNISFKLSNVKLFPEKSKDGKCRYLSDYFKFERYFSIIELLIIFKLAKLTFINYL